MEKLSYQESLAIIGGAEEGWDYTIAHHLGVAVGFTLKKLWSLFQLYSKNIYELQANTFVIYK
ncbi:MAG: hypothetical protein WC960_07335 [Bacteroidales bacterium]